MSPEHSPRPIPAILAAALRDGAPLPVRRVPPSDAGLCGVPGGKVEPPFGRNRALVAHLPPARRSARA